MQKKLEMIDRAKSLIPLIEREADNTEKNSRLSEKVIDQFCSAELPQLLVPKRFGGHEMDLETFSQIIYEIAPYCSSTAWVLAFYIGHNFIHALFPEKSQEEVFAEKSYALTPGTIAPNFSLTSVDGGYIANGRSQWNSGSSRCDWFLCSGLIKFDDRPPIAKVFLAPASEVTIIDNWNVAGMKGTASHDIEICDLFIPEHRVANTSDVLDGRSPGARIHDNPIYSTPLLPFTMGEVIPVITGAYKGAAETFKRITENRASAFNASKISAKQLAQMRIGQGIAGSNLAYDMMKSYVSDMSNSNTDQLRQITSRAALKAKAAMIIDFCTSGINDLMLGAGASSFRNDSPMQRYFRDINMLRVHGLLDLDPATETYGRVLLGLNPELPL
ncbi:MAG: hypothetical protein WC961_08220 [Anaerovoracaceae bacterium]